MLGRGERQRSQLCGYDRTLLGRNTDVGPWEADGIERRSEWNREEVKAIILELPLNFSPQPSTRPLPRGSKQPPVPPYGTQSLLEARGASISLTHYKAH